MAATSIKAGHTKQLVSTTELRWRDDMHLDLGPRVRPELIVAIMLLAATAAVLVALAVA